MVRNRALGAAIALGVLGLASAAPAAQNTLPPLSLTLKGNLESLAASGPTIAVATGRANPGLGDTDPSCAIQLFTFATAAPTAVRQPLPCENATVSQDAEVNDLALARNQIGATMYDSPSPHGEAWSYWRGPRPSGPLRQAGGDWGYTDSDVPNGWGCAWAVASGGGVIAAAKMPNRLGVDNGEDKATSCPAGAATTVELSGASVAQVAVAGSWMPLATDGKQVVLAGLADGLRTGELVVVDLAGRRTHPPPVDPASVKAAYRGWLAPEGLVLMTGKGLVGPGWTVPAAKDATVGQGRVVYRIGGTLRVRRIAGGADRPLLKLPAGSNLLAAGSFGVAIANGNSKVRVYRLPWRTIDRTLTG